MYDNLEQNAVITGKSPSFLRSYGDSLSRLALHYKLVPTEITTHDVNEYLKGILSSPNLPSETYFKFIIYSLRYVYKMYQLDDKHVSLPIIKTKKRLPVILSREEIIRLLDATRYKKHRVLILLLYGCGLRCAEAAKLKINDIDFDRRTIHIRNGKGGKHRYVPLSPILMDEIVEFLAEDHRSEYLLERSFQYRNSTDESISSNTICLTVRIALRRANIKKRASAHTLRHTFATHLLEDGLDVVSIKELLGHSRIETTMIYLHVAQCERYRAFSPLDTLYRPRIEFSNFPAFASQQLPMHKSMFLAEYN